MGSWINPALTAMSRMLLKRRSFNIASKIFSVTCVSVLVMTTGYDKNDDNEKRRDQARVFILMITAV